MFSETVVLLLAVRLAHHKSCEIILSIKRGYDFVYREIQEGKEEMESRENLDYPDLRVHPEIQVPLDPQENQ